MKNYLILALIVLASGFVTSQTIDTTAKLDLLKAPSSPGFILLNKQPTDIERPTTPTDFAFSIRNASDNFSAIPKNYAVEIAPAWLFGGKNITYDKAYGELSNKNPFRNIWQTMGLSCAVNSADTSFGGLNTQIAAGLKFSIIRGKISSDFTTSINKLNSVLAEIGGGYKVKLDTALAHDSIYIGLKKLLDKDHSLAPVIAVAMERILNEKGVVIAEQLQKEYDDKLKKLTNVKVQRYGWFLDAAGGMVIDFPKQIFENAQTNKVGAWLTGGYEGKKSISFLAVARYLTGTKFNYTASDSTIKSAINSSLDFGGRLIYDKNKFTASIEGLYRTNINTYKNSDGWKATFYIGYDLGNNKLLTLNVTRDFNGMVSKKGTLITALNLIIGFGSTRNVSNKK